MISLGVAMYRYLNLRGVESNPSFVPAMPGMPTNYPDDETDGRHFVFVHGYNVNADQSRDWARAMFKRLWWAGLKSKFIAVDWFGDDSQIPVPVVGDVSPNYYQNVVHAFRTAPALKAACDMLQGDKVMLAHSLGNMVVSAAAKDFGLQYAKYYLLNAAVPMEAYDSSASASAMIDGEWSNVPASFRAANWHGLFAGTDDFRTTLTWKGGECRDCERGQLLFANGRRAGQSGRQPQGEVSCRRDSCGELCGGGERTSGGNGYRKGRGGGDVRGK